MFEGRSLREQLMRESYCIGLFEFSEFSTSLKLTLIKKQIDQKLTHKWKNIFVNNLKFTTKIEILASKKFRIVSDILSCYREWKISVVTARDGCMNCVVVLDPMSLILLFVHTTKLPKLDPEFGIKNSSLVV